jgi:hypothetical protein
MKLSSEDQARLERLIGDGLSAQPPRRAPQTLQVRVWAELERRAALPWWHRSFRHWPISMRILFVLTALGVVWLVLSANAWSQATHAANQLAAPVSGELTWFQHVGAVLALLGSLCTDAAQALLQRIPGVWLYGAIAVLIAMYTMLAGIGVAAYRTMERAPSRV